MDSESTVSAVISKASRNQLSRYESYRLFAFVEQQFRELRKVDADFAEHAAQVLGFSVTTANVTSAREELRIPPLGDIIEQENAQALRRVQLLEERVERYEGNDAKAHGKYLGLNDHLAHLNARLDNVETFQAAATARMAALEEKVG